MLCEKLEEWGAVGLFANVEYEVDELARDTEILERTKEARDSGKGFAGQVEFLKDFCVVSPGELLTKVGAIRDICVMTPNTDSHHTAREAVRRLQPVAA